MKKRNNESVRMNDSKEKEKVFFFHGATSPQFLLFSFAHCE